MNDVVCILKIINMRRVAEVVVDWQRNEFEFAEKF